MDNNVIGQWTTPTTTFTVTGANFTEATKIYVTFRQNDYSFRIDDVTVVDDENISITLSQAQTGQFKEGKAQAQINWVFDNKRAMTYKCTIPIIDNLEDKEL